MISKIIGHIEEKNTHSVLVNVQGLCYELEVPITTSFSLPEIGADVSLFTHFVVRD
jgi:Holliday junction DNA helicase RuvA